QKYLRRKGNIFVLPPEDPDLAEYECTNRELPLVDSIDEDEGWDSEDGIPLAQQLMKLKGFMYSLLKSFLRHFGSDRFPHKYGLSILGTFSRHRLKICIRGADKNLIGRGSIDYRVNDNIVSAVTKWANSKYLPIARSCSSQFYILCKTICKR
ncbi:hypothetical protein HHI36_008619, partial [Cryptolaemus montrouzieri]